MYKQYISWAIALTIFSLSAGMTNAHEVEVQTGKMRVSVQNGNVEVDSNSGVVKTPSLLERLNNLRLLKDRTTSSERVNSNCDRQSSGYSTTRRNSSGTAVSRSSSSSTTMTCN